MRRMLVLSFSPIGADARVLKQVEEFSHSHAVVTCGYGEAPEGVAEHIRIPDDVAVNSLSGRLITLRWYRRVFWTQSAVRFAAAALRGRSFDVAIANDVEAVPVVLRLDVRDGVLADLHEYSPRLHEENDAWRRRIAPYVSWLCRRYVARADAWTTVSRGLAEEYEQTFGFRPPVVTNAAPFQDMTPSRTDAPIRLVHSGAGLRNRRLEDTVDAAIRTPSVTLDLYLTPNDPGYIEELRAQAADSDGRVRVNDAVPYAELPALLNTFDVGVFVLAPANFSYAWALPNKFFDYVQARLGVVTGPSPEVAEYVERYGVGIVAPGFDAAAIETAFARLDPASVDGYKHASDAAAQSLSAEGQVAIWREIIDGFSGTAAVGRV